MATARAVMALRPLPSPALGVALLLALLGSAAIQPACASAGEAAVMNCTCLPDNVGQPSQPGEPAGPVCGSDGNTYPDVCGLHCASQAGQWNLAMKHEGPCRHTREAESRERSAKPTAGTRRWSATPSAVTATTTARRTATTNSSTAPAAVRRCDSGSARPAPIATLPGRQPDGDGNQAFEACLLACLRATDVCGMKCGDPHCNTSLPKRLSKPCGRRYHQCYACRCSAHMSESFRYKVLLGGKEGSSPLPVEMFDSEDVRCMNDSRSARDRCVSSCAPSDEGCIMRCLPAILGQFCQCFDDDAPAATSSARAGAAPWDDSAYHDYHQCMIGCLGSCFQSLDGDPPAPCQKRALHCFCSCVPFMLEGTPIRRSLFPPLHEVETSRDVAIEGDEELGRCLTHSYADLQRCDGGCVAGDGACGERCARVTFDHSCKKCLHAGATNAHAGTTAARMIAVALLVLTAAAHWLH